MTNGEKTLLTVLRKERFTGEQATAMVAAASERLLDRNGNDPQLNQMRRGYCADHIGALLEATRELEGSTIQDEPHAVSMHVFESAAALQVFRDRTGTVNALIECTVDAVPRDPIITEPIDNAILDAEHLVNKELIGVYVDQRIAEMEYQFS
jgi:hypothetical protein